MNQEVSLLNSVLIPLESSLSDEQVLALYHAGRLPYKLQREDEAVIGLINKAVHRTMRCKDFLASRKTIDDVRTYFMSVFGGPDREYAIENMQDATLRKRFICEHLGRMLKQGIFFAKTHDLANALRYNTLAKESAMRYIRRGKNGK